MFRDAYQFVIAPSAAAAPALLFVLICASPAIGQGIAAWGSNSSGQTDVPALPPNLSYVEIAGGNDHTVARLSDGSVIAWGENFFGQTSVPALPSGLTYVEVAAGDDHTIARRSDGSVVAWGQNFAGQTNVPALPAGLSFVEVAAGGQHTVARRSDGSVVAWGLNTSGQTNVPAPPAGLGYVEIGAGKYHTVARTGPNEGSFTDLANPLAGTHGPPLLTGEGTLIAGDPVSFTLTQARENTTAALIVGTTALNAPLKGGVLVPDPLTIVFGLPTGPDGELALPTTWPPGFPPDYSIYLQYWVTDPAGPEGYAASNGLRATTP